jgi:hypothetical protein
MKKPTPHTTTWVSQSPETDIESVLSIGRLLGSVLIDMRNKFGGGLDRAV